MVLVVSTCAIVRPSGVSATAGSRQLTGQASAPGARAETIEVTPRNPERPFPHFWEQMFGSGRAILTLRDSYRQGLRAVKGATGFEYVRFHAIFHDEVGVYDETADSRPIYNFAYVDQIYDGLLENQVRPFVELSFMPRKLAAAQTLHAFWYKPIVSPPADFARWGDLITRFAQHLVERYGIDEVSQWYFEVWNEPNIDFWTGQPKETTYYELYDTAAAALKRVNQRLRVGGPATAQAAWIDRFIQHTVDGRIPVDFVSTHVYGNDSAKDVFGSDEPISRLEMVGRAARRVHDQVRSSPRPELPIIWSEYNASYKTEPDVTDAPFMGPWIADTIRQCDGLVSMMSYWTFSDVFEEQGVVKQPFYGGYGLIAEGGVAKPAFNAFKLLHRLGDRRLDVGSTSALVTRRRDGSLVIAVWNLALPDEPGTSKEVVILVSGSRHRRASISRVDATHGSPLAAYEAMGRPTSPTQDQLRRLRQAAELPNPETKTLDHGRVALTLPSHGLALVEIP
jgi:xylan 1,4-beta-xylosidase